MKRTLSSGGAGKPTKIAHACAVIARNGKPGASEHKLDIVHRFFAGTGNTYDFMVNAATFGIDKLWKRRLLDAIPGHASRVLDLACGTGILTLAIARRFPQCRVVGVELRDEYLRLARRKVRRLGLRNVELVLGRAEDYRCATPFDCVISSYLAKYADLATLTANTHAMLVDGGVVLMHDFTYPPKPYLASIWRAYFWCLQRIGGPLFSSWREIFFGLPDLIESTRWTEELNVELARCGFEDITMDYLTAYGSAIISARKGMVAAIKPSTATAP